MDRNAAPASMACNRRISDSRRRAGAAPNPGKDQAMNVLDAMKAKASSARGRTSKLFLLDLSGGRVLSMDPDGSNRRVIATDCPHPDGIVVDVEAGHVYWTNMGAVP